MINITPLSKNSKIFIEKANKKHNNYYDYSLVDYVGAKTPIKIICYEHGVFEQNPNTHLNGHGCPICGETSRIKTSTKSLSLWIKQSHLKHKGAYGYSNVNYVNNHTKVEIICSQHGPFMQVPTNHLNMGQGCPKCKGEGMSIRNTLTTEDFILKSTLIHGDLYDYSLVNYTDSLSKVKILCSKHGLFKQSPSNHIHSRQGCPKCLSSKGEVILENYLLANNISYISQKRFDGCRYKRTLPFDFYLPDYNSVIEFQGEQHYKVVERFGSKDGFRLVQERDKIKREFCYINNISYIEINKQNLNELQTIIRFYTGGYTLHPTSS